MPITPRNPVSINIPNKPIVKIGRAYSKLIFFEKYNGINKEVKDKIKPNKK